MRRMPAWCSLALYGLGTVDWQASLRRTGWPHHSPLERPRRSAALLAVTVTAGVGGSLLAARAAAQVAGVPRPVHDQVAAIASLAAASPVPVAGLAVQAAVEASLGRRLAEVTTRQPGSGGPGLLPAATRALRAVAGMTAWALVQALTTAVAERVADALATATGAAAGPKSRPVPTQLDLDGPDITAAGPEGYVVYLDGVGRCTERTTPVGRAFAAAVAERLPRWRVVLSVMPNDVTQAPMTARPLTGPAWRWLTRRSDTTQVARQVWEALAGLDPRYVEHIAHDQTGHLVAALLAAGYRPGSGTPVVVVGYSSGAQTALRTASAAARGLGGAPLDVVTVGAFADGSADLGGVRRVHTVVSWGDPAELLPVLLFPSRWTALGLGAWSAARQRRDVVVRRHDYATHLGRTGYLSPTATAPDGRTRLAQTADLVAAAARQLTGDRLARSRR